MFTITMKSFLRTYSKSKNSALAERFLQILDEQISHLTASVIDRDPTLKKLYEKYEAGGSGHRDNSGQNDLDRAIEDSQKQEHEFRDKFQKEIAYVQSEKLLRSRQARDLADTITNPPWNGTERTSDTALRMIVDSMPKAKAVGRQKTIITPPVPISDRIKNAKESSLDYKVSKTDKNDKNKDDNFRELYKERLMGPSMFVDATSPKATLGLIGSMADARINAAIDQKTGKFESGDMDSVRGKPLDRERLANSTDTNFFLNEILNKQDCLPPWIESQQGTQREISTFRLDLEKKWFNIMIRKLSDRFHDKMEMLRYLDTDARAISMAALKDQFTQSHDKYMSAKVDSLNQAIRSYNLQCPSSSLHKWKLVKDLELLRLYDQVRTNIKLLVEGWYSEQNTTRRIDPKVKGASDSFIGVFDSAKGSLSIGSGSQYNVIERPREQLHFWKLVKLIFKL